MTTDIRRSGIVGRVSTRQLLISPRRVKTIVELPQQKHPWFLACQFHPEFTSTPRDGHPLFNGFVRAAREYKAMRDAPRLAKEAAG